MIIWGFRSRNNVMGQMQYPCPKCGQNSFHTVVRSRRWFTLFFIPIFPFTKSSLSRCNICGFQTQIDNNAADGQFTQSSPAPQAIQPPYPQMPQYPTPYQQPPYPQQPQPSQYPSYPQPPQYPPYPQQY
jgi:zinc-ribbon family